MADFCTNCVKEWFETDDGGPEIKPDINVLAEFKQLQPGEYITCLCEGCTLCAIGNFDGVLKVQYFGKEGWVDYKFK